MDPRSAFALGALALLAGCDAGAPARATEGRWRIESDARSGTGLLHTDADGLVSEIRCREDPRDVMVFVFARRTPRALDGRLHLHLNGRTFSWPIDFEHDGAGVYAHGSNEPIFRQAMAQGGKLVVGLGGQQIRFSPLDPSLARRFAASCEALRA